jgi:undecaprenyl-diphosphatase
MFSVFKNINRFANKSKLLDGFAIFCARYLIYVLLFFLFLFAFFTGNWQIFVYPFLSGLFAAFVLDKIIYFFYKEHRPAELKNSIILIPVPKNPSFPSRHASLAFGISFCLLFYNFPLAIIFLILSCFIGVARVFCGVHWFHDILAGVFVGFISALTFYGLLNYFGL